jgi:hypothetical protein
MIMLMGFLCAHVKAQTPKTALPSCTTLSSTPKREDIKVRIDWMDKEGQQANVTLYANKKAYKTVTITKNDNWFYIFKNVPVTKNGKAIKYTISEQNLKGYATNIIGIAQEGFMVSNVETSKANDKTTIKINILWVGGTMKSVKVKLHSNGKVVKTVTLNKKNHYSASIKNMPIFDDQRQLITYSVSQQAADYTPFIKIGEHYAYSITNVNKSMKTVEPAKQKVSPVYFLFSWPLLVSALIVLGIIIITIATQVHKDHKED